MNALLYILAAAAAAVLGYVVLTADEADPLNPQGRETKIRNVTGAGYWKAGVEAWLVEGRIPPGNWQDLTVVRDMQSAKVYALAWKQGGGTGPGLADKPPVPIGSSKVG